MDFEALWLTLKLATSTTAILLIIAVPLAWWIASRGGVGRAVVQSVVALPLVLPPTVLGFYLLVVLGPLTVPGRLLMKTFGHPLAFSFAGLLVGSVLYSLPFAVQPFAAAFASVDSRLLAASATLGASRLRTFFQVVLPLSVSGLVTGIALSFAHTMGEFGVVLMVGGNIPGVTRTVSIDIFDKVQALNYSGANHTALVLLVISFLILAVVYGINRRALVALPWR